MVTVAPVPRASGDAGENDSVADEHGEKSVYGADAVASDAAVLAASRAQTPKKTFPAAPVLFQR